MEEEVEVVLLLLLVVVKVHGVVWGFFWAGASIAASLSLPFDALANTR